MHMTPPLWLGIRFLEKHEGKQPTLVTLDTVALIIYVISIGFLKNW